MSNSLSCQPNPTRNNIGPMFRTRTLESILQEKKKVLQNLGHVFVQRKPNSAYNNMLTKYNTAVATGCSFPVGLNLTHETHTLAHTCTQTSNNWWAVLSPASQPASAVATDCLVFWKGAENFERHMSTHHSENWVPNSMEFFFFVSPSSDGLTNWLTTGRSVSHSVSQSTS